MQQYLVFSQATAAAPGTAASSVAVTGTAPGAVAGVAMLAPVGLETFEALAVSAVLVGPTGGTLDVYIQTSHDGGTTWVDYAHFAQVAATVTARYTFAVSKAGQLLVPAVVGFGLTPALPAATVVGGAWGDRMRLVLVTGAGTSVAGSVIVRIAADKIY